MATKIIVPKMGQTVETCQLLDWFVEKGDMVEEGGLVFSIETDKAAFDIEAPVNGVVKEIFFEAGAEVPVGMVVGIIGAEDEDTSKYVPEVVVEGTE